MRDSGAGRSRPFITRLRVPLGFACAGVAFWLARPSPASVLAGMSVAALQALALRACLSHPERATLDARYLRATARVIDTPWSITVGNDRQLAPGGPHGTWAQRARYRWVQRVLRAGHHDHDVASAFLSVARLVSSPATLLRPDVVMRVLHQSCACRLV